MTLLLCLIGLGAVLLQMVLPAWFSLTGLHLAMVCLPPVYAVFYMGLPQALFLAVSLGLAQDILSPGMPGLGPLSIGLMLALLSTQRRLVRVEGGLLAMLLILLGTFFYLVLDYLFFSARLGRWHWPLDLAVRMVGESLVNALLLPPFTWAMDFVQSRWHGEKWKRRYLSYADS
jgi:cell shape-determining protein MreD